MFYKFARWCCMVYIRILYKIKVEGQEHVPKNQGYMLIANHRTNFDPLFVVAGVYAQVFYMAKVELFQKKWRGALLRALGAFPVERGKGDTGALDWAMEVLRKGNVLGMFPEGHRSKDGQLLRPKSGASMIAMQTGADVLPCAICFGERLKFRTPVTIRYGELIKNSQLGFTPGTNSPREIKEASKLMMDRLSELLEKGVS